MSFAALAVVSRASVMNDVSVGGRYSATSKSVANQNLTLSGGQKFENFRYDITVSGGEGNRGEGLYEDGLGNSTSMTDRTNLNPQLYALGFTAGGLQVRGLVDKLSTTHVHHGWNPVTGINYAETFDTYAAQAQYAIQLGSSFRLIPKYDFKLTEPWNIMDEDPLNTWESRKKSTRHRGALHADWDITPDLRLLSGIEYSSLVVDHQRDSILDKEGRIKNEFRTIFSEASLATVAGRFSLGARYEDSSLVDPAFVPRLAWTKAWNRFHLKAMDSTSFRSPAGIQPAPTRTFAGETLKPEIATTAEIEAGYRLSSQSTLVGNVFDMKVEDALVYETRGAVGAYSNLGTIGSRGAEAEYRFKGEKLDVNTSVAYYRSIATSVPSVQVPNEDGMNRAAPTLRVNLHPGYRFSQEFGIFPSAQYYSERWGLASDGTVKSFDPVVIVNANLRYMPAAVKGLQVTGGVMNLTDADLL
ncbi:MAG TPA: hypothetical protein PKC28_07310, partial [Bdellovibrionales bacterium]|nr:hypothetical protein [Bdellovibrionales bacterium]